MASENGAALRTVRSSETPVAADPLSRRQKQALAEIEAIYDRLCAKFQRTPAGTSLHPYAGLYNGADALRTLAFDIWKTQGKRELKLGPDMTGVDCGMGKHIKDLINELPWIQHPEDTSHVKVVPNADVDEIADCFASAWSSLASRNYDDEAITEGLRRFLAHKPCLFGEGNDVVARAKEALVGHLKSGKKRTHRAAEAVVREFVDELKGR